MPPRPVVAVIDVGSNSIRLLVARKISHLAFEVIDEERFDARLGQGQADGNLTPDGVERGLLAMRTVAEVAASHRPARTIVAGTEALRRAPNADLLIDAAFAQTGLQVRVLTAEEEAFASFLGTVNSTSLEDGYLVDIGGGSLELMDVRERSLKRAQSVPFGALYATEQYLSHDPPTPREVRALRKAVRKQLDVGTPNGVVFGVGGAVRNLARIVRLRRRYPLRRLHGLAIERRELRRLLNDLVRVPSEARRKIPGVSPSRADILPAAAIVLDEVLELTGATVLNVSGQGLREGLVWQELRGEAPVLPDVRAASTSGLARVNRLGETATEPTVRLAAQLFAATQALHELGPDELELLLTATRLAGIGMHIDYYDRDRHAEYLVHSGDLHGFSHREIVLLGALVRWAESGTPDLSPYKSILEAEDGKRAAILASLLGLARAVHRRQPSPVDGMEVTLGRELLLLTLRGTDALEAEIAAIQRQQKRFESVFGRELVVSVQS